MLDWAITLLTPYFVDSPIGYLVLAAIGIYRAFTISREQIEDLGNELKVLLMEDWGGFKSIFYLFPKSVLKNMLVDGYSEKERLHDVELFFRGPIRLLTLILALLDLLIPADVMTKLAKMGLRRLGVTPNS